MTLIEVEAKLKAASSFVLQSPPGEINDVLNDIRLLLSSTTDLELEKTLLPSLIEYNKEQFIPIPLVEPQRTLLLSNDSRILLRLQNEEEPQEAWFTPDDGAKLWKVDHINLTAEVLTELIPDPETEQTRKSISTLLSNYVKNHYHEGISQVYARRDDENYSEEVEEEEDEKKKGDIDQDLDVYLRREEVHKVQGQEEDDFQRDSAESVEQETKVVKGVEEAELVTDEEEKISIDTEATLEGETKTGEEDLELKDVPKTGDTPIDPLESETGTEPMIVVPKVPKVKREKPSRIFALYFVGNKYNPTNYWTGRWRSVYVVDFAQKTLIATTKINVHYFEQGNVQLSTTFSQTHSFPTSNPSAESIIAEIKKTETFFSNSLIQTLSEDGFKGLRRALPKNKSKIDWDKVGYYKLGRDLGGNQAEKDV